MTSTLARLCGALAVLLSLALPARAQEALVIGYVDRAGDARYAPVNPRDGVYRAQRYAPLPGAELGLRDATPAARAAGLAVSIRRRSLAPDEPVGAALRELAADGVRTALADLSTADLDAAAKDASGVVLMDIRDTDDGLRARSCAAPVFHVLPSRLARTDAVAQFLAKRNWKKLFVLNGPEEEDKAAAASMATSAKKFGVRIVEAKAFAATNDPRRREETNPALLTGGTDYDVVFLADSVGDVGRFVPFRTSLPRPVVGAHGLEPVAWHAFAERSGAPQLNRRFERENKRGMAEEDWAAWTAIRALVEAAVREKRTPTGKPLAERLLDPELRFDLYKGVPGSFRPWDKSMRQGVFLATHNAVIDVAPIEGFLHETNVLDTLGLLPSQTPCGSRP